MAEGQLSDAPVNLTVAEDEIGWRLDAYLAHKFPAYSRVHLHRVIDAAGVTVDGRRVKAAHRLQPGEKVAIVLPDMPRSGPLPENIPLDIVYEDQHMAVVNKPSGMVVHPAKGHWSGTLTAALQFHFDSLSSVGGPSRPGIVHRLDRDTSGLLAVAKTDHAHFKLCEQWEARTVGKEYLAIVVGVPDRDRDVIQQPIGIHPYQREKMAIRRDHSSSRPAQSFYEVLERFDGFALLRVEPKTGRTHQIRVHMAHAGYAVLCDRLYGGRARITRGELHHTVDDTPLLERQALHASRLTLKHPETGMPLDFQAPLPADLSGLLEEIRTVRPALKTNR